MKRIVNLAPIVIATAIIVLVLIFVDYRLISSSAKKSSSLLRNSSKQSSPSPSAHNKIAILISKIDAMSKKLDALSKSVDEFINSDKKVYYDDSSSYDSNISEPRSFRNKRIFARRNYPPLNVNDNLYFKNMQKKLFKENPFFSSFDKSFAQQKNLKPSVNDENPPEINENMKVLKQLSDKKEPQIPFSSNKQSKIEKVSLNRFIMKPEVRISQKRSDPLQITKVDSQSLIGKAFKDKENDEIPQFKKKPLKVKDIDDDGPKNSDTNSSSKTILSSGKGNVTQTTDRIIKTNIFTPIKSSTSDEKRNSSEETKLSKDPLFFSPISNNKGNGPFDAITDLTDFSFGPVIKSLESTKQKTVKLGEDLDVEKSPLEELTKSLFAKTLSDTKNLQQQKEIKSKENTENKKLKPSSLSGKIDKQESFTGKNNRIPMEKTSPDDDKKENKIPDIVIAKEVTGEKLKAQIDRDRKIEEDHLKKEKIKEEKKNKRKEKGIDLVMSKTTVSLDHSHDDDGNIAGIIVKKDVVTEEKLPVQKEIKGSKKDKKGEDKFEQGEKSTRKEDIKAEVLQELTLDDNKPKSEEDTLEEILSKPFGASKETSDFLKLGKDLEEASRKKTRLPLSKKNDSK